MRGKTLLFFPFWHRLQASNFFAMQINLSWDLFILVFFMIIVAYSYVIGKYQTLKIILSSYIAILAADGLGNLVEQYLIGEKPVLNVFVATGQSGSLITFKIAVFVIITILLATKGRFGVMVSAEKNRFVAFSSTIVYGILSAGLIISTILVYMSGISLFEVKEVFIANPVDTIAAQSRLVTMMITHYNVWFSLPAVVFIFSSFFGDEAEG